MEIEFLCTVKKTLSYCLADTVIPKGQQGTTGDSSAGLL